MSESQQGPEICDIISRKRYFNSVCLIHLLLGGKRGGGGAKGVVTYYASRQFLKLMHHVNELQLQEVKLNMAISQPIE